MRNLIAAAALLSAASVSAADADHLWREGRFAAAAAAAREGGDQTLASRAQLVAAAFEATSKEQALQMLDQAGRSANAALARNPGDAEALVQRAVATGYTAKLTRNPKLAKQSRAEMQHAVAVAPNLPDAWAAIGGWHGDAIADVGSMLAGMLLGAKKAEATRGFETAMAKDAASPVYPAYYALMLLRTDKGDSARAATLLERAAALRPRDGFEALMRNRAAQLLVPLKAGDAKAARKLVEKLQPFGRFLAK